MAELNNFVGSLKDYIDRKLVELLAKNNTIDNTINTTLNGYRGMGVHQLMMYGSDGSDSSYTIGSSGSPTVSK